MKIEEKNGPSGTVAHCWLEANEKMIAESGALMALSPSINMTTSTHSRKSGGISAGIKRLFSGQSFFLNHFEAKTGGELWLSTPLPGDILVHPLKGESLIVSGGSYVGSSADINIDLEFQGLKSLFSGENLFWIKAQGTGPVILSSFGEIFPVVVDGEFVVDTGHIVAFEETLSFKISKYGGSWIHSFLGGEGLVCLFKGRGTIWCQSHNATGFGRSLTPYLRERS